MLKDQSTLPEEGLAMIRYHSFYPYVRSFLLLLHFTNYSIIPILKMAPRERLFTSHQRKGRQDASCCARVQPVRLVQQERRAVQRREAASVLRGPDRQVLPRPDRLVNACRYINTTLSRSSTTIRH